MKKIAVVGATGCTGRQTCEKLLEMAATFASDSGGAGGDFRIVLGGRDRAELERLSMDLGQRYRQAVDIHLFDFTDRPSLRLLCDNSAVVVNCAAPFAVSGPPVLASSVHARAHLIDPSNETGYLESCAMRSSVVKEAGIAVVNGIAVDPGIADLAIDVAVKGWEPVNSVDVLYTFRGLEETAGMRASTLETLKQPCRAYIDRSLQVVKVASKKRDFKWNGGSARGKIMPGGEVFLLPRHLPGVRNVASYRVLGGGHGMFVGMLGGALSGVGMMMVQKWARDGVKGASDESEFAVILDIEGVKSRRMAVARGRCVYATTASMLATAALTLATEGARATGVVSPAQTFDPARLLRAAGVEVEVADAARV